MYNDSITKAGLAVTALEPPKEMLVIDGKENALKQLLAFTKAHYEIESDELFGKAKMLTIRLYVPGYSVIGRYIYAPDSVRTAINCAVLDAMEQVPWISFKDDKEPQEPVPELKQEDTQKGAENADRMMQALDEMLGPQPGTMQQSVQGTGPALEPDMPITTAEQFNNLNKDEIPFDQMQLPNNELMKLLTGETTPEEDQRMLSRIKEQEQQASAVQAQQARMQYQQEPQPPMFMNPPVQNTQPVRQPGPLDFTRDQLNRINKFKQDFNITNDEIFAKYVNSWNPAFNNKKNITAANIDAFLEYTEQLKKWQG